MELNEIKSNTVKTISTSLLDSITELFKSKDLEIFHANYLIYDLAWRDWKRMMQFLHVNKEPEYIEYSKWLVKDVDVNTKISAISFDEEIKTLEEFIENQTQNTNQFPFFPNEIIAWDTDYFILDDNISQSVLIMVRADKNRK